MEEALLDILAAIREGDQTLDARWLERTLRRHNQGVHSVDRLVTKRALLPFYLDVRDHSPARWESWGVTPEEEAALLRILRKKPRRTASGVATITVLTKPWPCSSDCLYCPNDIRMPKSYLANEPACQRAEHNFFDPYLQVKARLHVLEQMGHVTDKVELIVLGGTWSDYPEDYQRWFIRELFRAVNDDAPYVGGPELNDSTGNEPTDDLSTTSGRTAAYDRMGFLREPDELERESSPIQTLVNTGELGYNQAISKLLDSPQWQEAAHFQQATWEELEAEHHTNETARRRVVGLVIEIRPDLITPESARTLRRLGCTKVQMGIQSLDDAILQANERQVTTAQIARAVAILRTYGFKLHIHMMANLVGSTPDTDRADYLRLVQDERFLPDEVKLYPCALVASSRLMRVWEQDDWRPYTTEELVDLLVDDVLATPGYVRISRMIRDIGSDDIVAGNKHTNLRQIVEGRLASRMDEVREIRLREVATNDVATGKLVLGTLPYRTSTSEERFLQWTDGRNHIAGFCRLSLPDEDAAAAVFVANVLPTPPGTAMIREVHVYGRVAGIGASEQGAAQHTGLGKALVEEACRQAREAGYAQVAVISAIGTRPYYRSLGFTDAGLYQLRQL